MVFRYGISLWYFVILWYGVPFLKFIFGKKRLYCASYGKIWELEKTSFNGHDSDVASLITHKLNKYMANLSKYSENE